MPRLTQKNSVHFVMQAKGGVGKSSVAVALGEYISNTCSLDLAAFDTDPANRTLYEFSSLRVKYIDSLRGFRVGETMLDPMMASILNSSSQTTLVDVGTSNYLPIRGYLEEADVLGELTRAHRPVYIHAPIVSGGDHAETLKGLQSLRLLATDKGGKIIVWDNDVRGVIKPDTIEALRTPPVAGVVALRVGFDAKGNPRGDGFLDSHRLMMEHRLLHSDLVEREYFDDSESIEIDVIKRMRLNQIWTGVVTELDRVNW